MKDLSGMNEQELLIYFINVKLKGTSIKDIVRLFEKNNINRDTQKMIMEKLDIIDKNQRKRSRKAEKSGQKIEGIKMFFIGVAIFIFGYILYARSKESGVFFVFNIVFFLVGGILILKGLANFIAGFVKK